MTQIALHTCLREAARRQPNALLFSGVSGAVSYADAERYVDRTALRLSQAQLRSVCIRVEHGPDSCLDLLACLRAGVAVLWSAAGTTALELKGLAAVGGVRHVLARGELSGVARLVCPGNGRAHSPGDNRALTAGKVSGDPSGEHSPARSAAVDEGFHALTPLAAFGPVVGFATSGSTGAPRIALRSSTSLAAEGARYVEFLQLSAADCIGAALPLGHSFGFGAVLCAALQCGARIAFLPTKLARQLAHAVLEEAVTFLPLVRAFASPLEKVAIERGKVLRTVMVGAGSVTLEQSQRFCARWGVELSRNYGSSETGAVLATHGYDADAGTGRALPGWECKLVAAAGGGGQLWVRSAEPPLGLLGAEGHDRSRLSPDGFWSTGDVFEPSPGGGFGFVARVGGLVRRGGHGIAPVEVERVIARHIAVEEVVVAGEPDLDGEQKLVAYVQTQVADHAALRAEVTAALQRELASYKHPSEWRFVAELPKTWSGKVKAPGVTGEQRTVSTGRMPLSAAPSPLASAGAVPLMAICKAPSGDVHAAGPSKGGAASLRAALSAYRKTEAVLAAEQLGLLRALQRPKSVRELAQELALDPRGAELLLLALKHMGLVEVQLRAAEVSGCAVDSCNLGRGDAVYVLSRGAGVLPEAFVWLERELRSSWLSADALVAAVRAPFGERPFEREGASERFAEIYRAALCGPAQAVLYRTLARRVAPPAAATVWEIGRAIGGFSAGLAAGSVRLSPLAPAPALIAEQVSPAAVIDAVSSWSAIAQSARPASVDVIALVNAVHWLPVEQAREVLAQLYAALRPGGVLCIVDTFIERHADDARALWLLDWLTHGGVFFLEQSALEPVLRDFTGAPPVVQRVPGFDFVCLRSANKQSHTQTLGIRDESDKREIEVGVDQSVAP